MAKINIWTNPAMIYPPQTCKAKYKAESAPWRPKVTQLCAIPTPPSHLHPPFPHSNPQTLQNIKTINGKGVSKTHN